MPKFIGCGPNIDQVDGADQRECVHVTMSQVRALRSALGRKPRGFVTVDCSDRGGPRQLAKRWYVRYVLAEDLAAAYDKLNANTRIKAVAGVYAVELASAS
jgi:hypothetical protein